MDNRHSDPAVEALLERFDIDWTLEYIDPSEVDWEATGSLQTRDRFVDDDIVDRYQAAIEDGAILPAVLAMGIDGQTTGAIAGVALLGGVHRTKAWEAANAKVAAYVVGPLDPATAYMVSIEHNATHGQPLTDDERARHALCLIDEYGLTVADAARRVGAPRHLIGRARSAREYRRRAAKNAISTKPSKAIPHTGQHHLADALAGLSDHAFVEAVLTARNVQAGAEGCIALAKQIRGADGETAVLQAIEDFEVTYRPDGSKPGGKTRPAHTMRATARAFLEAATDAAVDDVADQDIVITLELIGRVGARAATVARRLT